MREINVNVTVRPVSYRLVIGSDLMDIIADELAKHPLGRRYAIITDSTVAPLWAEKLEAAFCSADIAFDRFVFPAGEESKNRAVKEELENRMMAAHYTRDCAVIALGGGVVGDMAGFVAATYMRGLPVIQIPTTTLAMADSSIGGKTAVDTPYGKNLIGAFHHPSVVYMDMDILKTLDERNYRNGLAELIKHGFIRDPELLDFVESHVSQIDDRDNECLEKLFTMNCRVKNDIVSEDEKEAGIRQILNYGHTMGHAVEMASGLSLLHGECVAIGMAFASQIAVRKGICSSWWQNRQNQIIGAMGLPAEVPSCMDADKLIELMRMDKKSRDGEFRFVLPVAPGKVAFGVPVSEEEIREALEETRAAI